MRERDLQIVHVSSGNLNPIILQEVQELVHEYAKFNPFYRQVGPTNSYFVSNPKVFEFLIAVTETLPIKIMDFASQLPYIGSDDLKNKAKLASKISGKMKKF